MVSHIQSVAGQPTGISDTMGESKDEDYYVQTALCDTPSFSSSCTSSCFSSTQGGDGKASWGTISRIGNGQTCCYFPVAFSRQYLVYRLYEDDGNKGPGGDDDGPKGASRLISPGIYCQAAWVKS